MLQLNPGDRGGYNWVIVPSEATEQIDIAKYLDANGFCWCHVPNEVYGLLHPASINKLREQGLKSGVPDIIIFDTPTIAPWSEMYKGAVIEMKRQDPKYKDPSEDQVRWLDMLAERGYLRKVAKGALDGIVWLRQFYTEHAPNWAMEARS